MDFEKKIKNGNFVKKNSRKFVKKFRKFEKNLICWTKI